MEIVIVDPEIHLKVQEIHLKHRDLVLGTLVRIDWNVRINVEIHLKSPRNTLEKFKKYI